MEICLPYKTSRGRKKRERSGELLKSQSCQISFPARHIHYFPTVDLNGPNLDFSRHWASGSAETKEHLHSALSRSIEAWIELCWEVVKCLYYWTWNEFPSELESIVSRIHASCVGQPRSHIPTIEKLRRIELRMELLTKELEVLPEGKVKIAQKVSGICHCHPTCDQIGLSLLCVDMWKRASSTWGRGKGSRT